MIYINSDNLVKLEELDSNEATVTGQLLDRVSGEALYEFDLTYVEDSAGTYVAVVPSNLPLEEDQRLTIKMIADVNGSLNEFRSNEVAGYARI